jgi:hypothetical protein
VREVGLEEDVVLADGLDEVGQLVAVPLEPGTIHLTHHDDRRTMGAWSR